MIRAATLGIAAALAFAGYPLAALVIALAVLAACIGEQPQPRTSLDMHAIHAAFDEFAETATRMTGDIRPASARTRSNDA